MDARTYLINLYLDCVNNWLSVATFSEHHGLNTTQGGALLELARDVYNSKHPEA